MLRPNGKKGGLAPRSSQGLWLLLLLPLGFMTAAEPVKIEKTIETIPTPRINVSNLFGHVVVRGWDKTQVHAYLTISSPRVAVDTEIMPASGPSEKVHFTTRDLDSNVTGPEEMADYILDVPTGSNLEIRNPQGSVRIEKLAGDTEAETVGGDIVVTDVAGHLAVKSIGGDIEIVRPAGRVEASTITGNLHFLAPSSLKIHANITGSGRLIYEGDFMPLGDYVFSTYSGDMQILCLRASSFELRAKTVKGRLDNQVALIPKRRHNSPLPYGATSLLALHNEGRATLDLTSFSGTIHILPQ